MIDGGNRYDGVCFSSACIDIINEKAYSLDNRLYLFAYYDPKPYLENETWFSRFKTAITNLYGLLWDCCPFLIGLISKPNSILGADWKKTRPNILEVKRIVGAFRSIFCHNCSDVLTLNNELYYDAEEWIAQCLNEELGIWDLTDCQWETLLEEIENMAHMLVDTLEKCLNNLLITTDTTRKYNTIERWLFLIAETYNKNPEYLLNTMAALFQQYLDFGGDYCNINLNLPLRNQTIQWLVNNCYTPSKDIIWYSKWLSNTIKFETRRENAVYKLLENWPERWAKWSGTNPAECEPPLPGGDFFRVLASDVDAFAANPIQGYASVNSEKT